MFSHINFSFLCPHPETAFPSIHPAISATYFPLKKRIIVSGLTTAHKIHWNLRSKNVLLHLNLKTPAVQSQVCNSKPTAKKWKCQGPDTFLNIPDFALGKQWEYCLFCFVFFFLFKAEILDCRIHHCRLISSHVQAPLWWTDWLQALLWTGNLEEVSQRTLQMQTGWIRNASGQNPDWLSRNYTAILWVITEHFTPMLSDLKNWKRRKPIGTHFLLTLLFLLKSSKMPFFWVQKWGQVLPHLE